MQEYIGRKIEEVEKELKEAGRRFRVLMVDGKVYAGTTDMSPTRYNFSVQDGIITSVKLG